MPAAVVEQTDRPNKMPDALKKYIMRERARKKQEREAEVEEERLRKEREAREQQDVMTLGETKEQITQLEAKLALLKEEKHQLFLQLKKVLNEDDNRRKQHKETSDMVALQALPPGLVHQQLYMPQSMQRGAPIPQQGFKTTTKRPRSPSPPPSSIPMPYHQTYGYKPGGVANTTYMTSPQKDDARRHEFVRAVLWNKQQIYQVPPPQELIYYSQPGAIQTREPTRPVFETARPAPYHLEPKPMEHHYTLRPASHVMHASSMPLSAAQPAKAGSITAGYPVRQTQYQQPPPATASALYTAQSRPLYQSPSSGAMNYQPRD